MSRRFPAGVATGQLVTDIFNYAKEILKRHLFCDFLPSVGTYPLIKYCNKVSVFVEENKNKLDCVDTNASVIIGKVFFEIFEFSKRKGITFRFSMLSCGFTISKLL